MRTQANEKRCYDEKHSESEPKEAQRPGLADAAGIAGVNDSPEAEKCVCRQYKQEDTETQHACA